MPAKLPRILIVEDDKPMARTLGLKLQHSGFDIEIVNNGQVALDVIHKEKFNLILLDLMLPDVDGFAIMADLHSHKIKTPVIVTTNLSQEDDAKKVKDLGALGYFVKADTPINKIVDFIIATLIK